MLLGLMSLSHSCMLDFSTHNSIDRYALPDCMLRIISRLLQLSASW